jgi:hypothetical protein
MRRLRVGNRQIRTIGGLDMRAKQVDDGKMQRVRLFADVHTGLSGAFEAIALRDAIKTPGYDEPTAGSTALNKRSIQDNATDSAWVLQTARRALTELEWAWVVCSYDGAGEARRDALGVICAYFANLHKNAAMVRAVFDREFVLGETWCVALPGIAAETGVSLRTVERVTARARLSLNAVNESAATKLEKAFSRQGWMRVYRKRAA